MRRSGREEAKALPDITVEEAVKRNCQALLLGDLSRLMMDLTQEAMAQMMAAGAGPGAIPQISSFDIQSHEQQEEDHIFKIKFVGVAGETVVTATWRDIEGEWKIAALQLPPPQP